LDGLDLLAHDAGTLGLLANLTLLAADQVGIILEQRHSHLPHLDTNYST
jgi:hypothetical protein